MHLVISIIRAQITIKPRMLTLIKCSISRSSEPRNFNMVHNLWRLWLSVSLSILSIIIIRFCRKLFMKIYNKQFRWLKARQINYLIEKLGPILGRIRENSKTTKMIAKRLFRKDFVKLHYRSRFWMISRSQIESEQ